MNIIVNDDELTHDWNMFVASRTNNNKRAYHDMTDEEEEDDVWEEEEEKEKKIKEKRKVNAPEIRKPNIGALYISTMSKIAYFSTPIPLDVFWALAITLDLTETGIVKKQMLMTSWSQTELDHMRNTYIKNRPDVRESVKRTIIRGNKFKDERKISVGVSTHDAKKRGKNTEENKMAFMNCFVLQLRVRLATDELREFHAKIFNTGKVEFPGVQSSDMLQKVIDVLCTAMSDALHRPVAMLPKTDMVLINSNFKCGFLINRYKCFRVLRKKYGVNAMYDPCSYPGIKCHFYHNPEIADISIQSGKDWDTDGAQKISFMIFRTGSVLIVGKCEESILYQLYNYIVRILVQEYHAIQ